jgi:hypothetical protein
LTRGGLAYGEQFVPFDEMVGTRPASHVLWNPATNLFEVTVARRSGPDLVLKNLPPQTAERLGEAITGALIEGGNRGDMFSAYLFSAGLMIFAAIVEIFLGVKAEGQSLESVATPLTAVENRPDPATA